MCGKTGRSTGSRHAKLVMRILCIFLLAKQMSWTTCFVGSCLKFAIKMGNRIPPSALHGITPALLRDSTFSFAIVCEFLFVDDYLARLPKTWLLCSNFAHAHIVSSSPNSTGKLTKFNWELAIFNWEAHQIQLRSSPNSTAMTFPCDTTVHKLCVLHLICKTSVVQSLLHYSFQGRYLCRWEGGLRRTVTIGYYRSDHVNSRPNSMMCRDGHCS